MDKRTPAVRHFPDITALSAAAASMIAEIMRERVAAQGVYTLVLAGGNTPRALYGCLAREPYAGGLPWESVHLFWGDERFVPADDMRSNYRMVRETLLDRVPVPVENVHAIDTSLPTPSVAAAAYESHIKAFFKVHQLEPSFDLALLGIGADGHTASLFPGDTALSERKRWVVPTAAPPGGGSSARITLTLPALNLSRHIMFIAAMPGKEPVLHALEQGRGTCPAGMIRGRETTHLLIADTP